LFNLKHENRRGSNFVENKKKANFYYKKDENKEKVTIFRGNLQKIKEKLFILLKSVDKQRKIGHFQKTNSKN
jgi:hypothetical protein